MATVVERLPVNRLYVWAGLTVLIGLSITASSTMSLLSGAGTTYDWFMIIAGVSMIVGTAWEARYGDPTEFAMNGYWLGFLVLCTLLAVGGSVLAIAGLL